MKRKKINKIISTSIASSLILGTVAQNVTVVHAAELSPNTINADVEQVQADSLIESKISETNQLPSAEQEIDLLESNTESSNKTDSTQISSEIKESIESDKVNTSVNTNDSNKVETSENTDLTTSNDEISLPNGFSSNIIGNQTQNSSAKYDEETKSFTIKGNGTYIGKDPSATDDYQFVNYKVQGDATIIARLTDFDMSKAPYGQAGVFIRNSNTTNDCDYLGIYVEPSKNQYRYAYRGNSNSGAAAISGLDNTSKNKFIKIVKTGNSFRYYISDDLNFDGNNVLTNSQTINNDDDTWYVGFVVSNGAGNTSSSIANFDNVTIKDENGTVYSSNPQEDNKDEEDKEEVKESVLKFTEEPNSTVSNKNIKLAGQVQEDGLVKVLLNGVLVDEEISLDSNDTFNYDLNLNYGRNSIEIVHTNSSNEVTSKKYSILCMNNTSYDIIVDSNYTGTSGSDVDGIVTYKTVSEAISSISTKNKERKVIFIKNGTYKEKLTIESPYVSLIGEDKDKTILTYDDANGTVNPSTGTNLGTSKSASVYVKSKAFGFTAENLTIENSFVEKGNVNEQAVAFNNEADQSIMVNCKFIANQDTLLANASSSKSARQYYYKCEIEGDVDFIFGRAQAVFNDCDIVSLNRNSTSNNGYITAANTWGRDSYGYLIMNSRLLSKNGTANNTVSLGRPWRPSNSTDIVTPAVTYVNCYMGDHITTKGWDDMGADSLAKDSRFNEYGSYGPGAKTSNTRPILTEDEQVKYSMETVFAKNSATIAGSDAFTSDWNPHNADNDLNNVSLNSLYKNIDIDNNKPGDDNTGSDEDNNGTGDDNTGSGEDNNGAGDDNTGSGEDNNGTGEGDTGSGEDNNGAGDDNTGSGENNNGTDEGDTGSGEDNNGTGEGDTGSSEDNNESGEDVNKPVVNKPGVENPDNNIILTSKNWVKNNDKTLSLVYNGVTLTGWQKVGNYWYYLNESGIMQSNCWINFDNNSYYLKSNGTMVTGWLKLNDTKYYLNSDGTMVTGWYTEGKKTYYLSDDGSITTGLHQIDNKWYNFKTDGTMTTGWVKVDNDKYYFDADGSRKTGWHIEGKKTYYLSDNGLMVYGLTEIEGKTYYFKTNGSMATGWVDIKDENGKKVKYYFDVDGSSYSGWLTYKNKTYYISETGSMTIGWYQIDNKWYYFNTNGTMVTNKTVDGYKLDKNGSLIGTK